MNLRILKKLSKRAAPLLAHFDIGPDDLFLAEKSESYTGLLILDRTCWDRGRSVHDDCIRQCERKKPAADGNGWVYMTPPSHPLKGTPMVGRMSGYEEPEWEERTALEELAECIRWSDKPATMTEAEWALAQRITRTKPVTQDEIDEMLNDMDEAMEGDLSPMEAELSL
ncbi:hypothetical protein [Azospirillum picis]|uniref:Uncharacterized protein n=1 Tax=Azospirillum picis TaxID=488438 RepID=A0ABU0MRX4_9PROT|nr:hypothetical protein [Azospirillum picis]MBP2302543.1 hypothetical protein [Azospirillum picis]MDQ0536215.1 hypothetical protein [Azospirillum picis]